MMKKLGGKLLLFDSTMAREPCKPNKGEWRRRGGICDFFKAVIKC